MAIVPNTSIGNPFFTHSPIEKWGGGRETRTLMYAHVNSYEVEIYGGNFI